MSTLPLSGLLQWEGPVGSPWAIVNKFMLIYEGMAERASIEDRNLTEAPASCDNGARFLVAGPTTLDDPWDNHEGELAIAIGTNAANGWYFIPIAREGFEIYVRDENQKAIFEEGVWLNVATGSVDASDVAYEPQAEGFYAGTVEEALDQLFAMAESATTMAAEQVSYSPLDTGFYSANVRDALDEIIAELRTISQSGGGGGGSGGGYSEGTAFPGSPTNGQMFFKTDVGSAGELFRYNSSVGYWLSATPHLASLTSFQNAQADFSVYFALPYLGTYSIFLDRLDVTTFRTLAGEWDVLLQWVDSANSATTISTIDGSGNATSTWVPQSASPAVIVNANAKALQIAFDEVSGTSALFGNAILAYRLAVAG